MSQVILVQKVTWGGYLGPRWPPQVTFCTRITWDIYLRNELRCDQVRGRHQVTGRHSVFCGSNNIVTRLPISDRVDIASRARFVFSVKADHTSHDSRPHTHQEEEHHPLARSSGGQYGLWCLAPGITRSIPSHLSLLSVHDGTLWYRLWPQTLTSLGFQTCNTDILLRALR